MIRTFTYFLLAILLLGVSIFATQNQQIVTLKFFNLESINLPLGLVLVFSAGLGTILTTALQVSNRQVYRQVASSDTFSSQFNAVKNDQRSNSRTVSRDQTTRTQAAKPPIQEKIADFDDDFNDDWD